RIETPRPESPVRVALTRDRRLPPVAQGPRRAPMIGGMSTLPSPDSVLSFWFEEIEPKMWWVKSNEFDRLIESRFGAVHRAAGRCGLSAWRATPAGRLAEVIVLDQFSRNMHRDTPLAFACDLLALALSQEAVAAGADMQVEETRRVFFYMPYMHS